jgi:hypothetical protein
MHHKKQSRVIDVAVICKKKENVTEMGNTDMYFDVVVKGAKLHVLFEKETHFSIIRI